MVTCVLVLCQAVQCNSEVLYQRKVICKLSVKNKLAKNNRNSQPPNQQLFVHGKAYRITGALIKKKYQICDYEMCLDLQ